MRIKNLYKTDNDKQWMEYERTHRPISANTYNIVSDLIKRIQSRSRLDKNAQMHFTRIYTAWNGRYTYL